MDTLTLKVHSQFINIFQKRIAYATGKGANIHRMLLKCQTGSKLPLQTTILVAIS